MIAPLSEESRSGASPRQLKRSLLRRIPRSFLFLGLLRPLRAEDVGLGFDEQPLDLLHCISERTGAARSAEFPSEEKDARHSDHQNRHEKCSEDGQERNHGFREITSLNPSGSRTRNTRAPQGVSAGSVSRLPP